MAKIKNLGYTDTPIEGVSSLTFARAILNLGKDFRIIKNVAGKEVVLTNMSSPIDRPEKIRIGILDIANVYSGSGIDPSVSAPTKRGVQILIQVTNVMSVTDDTDPDYRIDLPLSAHTIIRVPVSEHITAADIQTLMGRLLSAYYDSGVSTTTRLEALFRGSLVPSEL